ncbi:MAG TPA: hypothetical protein VF928_05560 [Usitatibacteraceae bacterium]
MNKRSVFLISLALFCATSAHGKDWPVDLSTTQGLEQTCTQFRGAASQSVSRDADKVAFAICSGIDMARDALGWYRINAPKMNANGPGAVKEVRAKLEGYLVTIETTRKLLETIKTTKPLLTIQPGQWELDMDGDGTISPFEKHFFWIPKRGADINRQLPSFNSMEEYEQAMFTRPTIKVDQSDVYWAIAYCHFAEATLNLLLSYELVDAQQFKIQLADPERVKSVAYPSLLGGIAYSRKLRESLQKETSDENEWIPNARQKNTSFPLVMDEQTFATWGELLGHMDKLFRGKTLMGGSVTVQNAMVRDLSMGLCKPGEGVDVRDLFQNPIVHPTERSEWQTKCKKATPALPLTGLAAMIDASIKRNSAGGPENLSGEWMILRHFYWVN